MSTDSPPTGNPAAARTPTSSDPLFNPELAAAGHPFPFDTAVTGLVEITSGEIAFTPVPRLRRRRNGWTPDAQRAFIAALEACGCVARAARAVGMTPRSAYRLLDAAGADSFAEAWDQAIARGIDRLRGDAIDRALNGAWVPVIRRGKVARTEHRINDRLAIALLSGRESSVADRRERAASRRRHRERMRARRAELAAAEAHAAAIAAEHQALLDRLAAEEANPRLRRVHVLPRIRFL